MVCHHYKVFGQNGFIDILTHTLISNAQGVCAVLEHNTGIRDFALTHKTHMHTLSFTKLINNIIGIASQLAYTLDIQLVKSVFGTLHQILYGGNQQSYSVLIIVNQPPKIIQKVIPQNQSTDLYETTTTIMLKSTRPNKKQHTRFNNDVTFNKILLLENVHSHSQNKISLKIFFKEKSIQSFDIININISYSLQVFYIGFDYRLLILVQYNIGLVFLMYFFTYLLEAFLAKL